MKKIATNTVINILFLYIITSTTNIFGTLSPQVLTVAALVLTFIITVIQPIVVILFTPINFLTMGFLRWVPITISIYILTLSLESISATPLRTNLISIGGTTIPPIQFGSLSTFLILTLIYSLTSKFITWITHSEKEK